MLITIVTSPSNGTVPPLFVMPPGVPSGVLLYSQWTIADAGANKGVAISTGVLATFH